MEKSEISREWREILARGYLDVEGIRFDVTHLRDAEYCFRIEATGRHPELAGTLFVQCSSHCASWGAMQGKKIDFGVHGEQRRITDERGIDRCFCDIRHIYSTYLPGVFETFVERDCLFTGRRNWLTVQTLDTDDGPKEYEVFFHITRQSSQALRIVVGSAYVRDPHRSGNKPTPLTRRGKLSAKVLMAKTLQGERIRQPPGGGNASAKKHEAP